MKELSKSKKFGSNSEYSRRMFDNDFLESLSKVHFYIPLLIFIPTIAYFLGTGLTSTDMGPLTVIYFLFGFITWTVTEYAMHRFVFHFHPTSTLGKKIHFIFHGVHHDFPKDRLRLVLPPVISIPLATMFYLIFRQCIPGNLFYIFFAAFLLGYLIYDMLHYAIHHVEFKGSIWKILKTHHLKHHYVDDTKGFGVSSKLWDLMLRSDFAKRKLYSHK